MALSLRAPKCTRNKADSAEETVRLISRSQRRLMLGAETGISVNPAARAVEAGAAFVVSSGFDPAVVDWCIAHQVAVIPRIATPTEALK